MKKLALFDLDHTLLPLDSDNEWGQFLVRQGQVDAAEFGRKNADFYAQYQAGTLDPDEYLRFALGTLARFAPEHLAALRAQFMQEVIQPALLPAAFALLQRHRDAGDLLAIVTATNRYVTEPIAQALGVPHLVAAEPELDSQGRITGRLSGRHNNGEGKIHNTRSWLQRLGHDWDSFDAIHFYSDSHNDIPLLSVVSHPVATNPNTRLSAHAKAQGWPELNLFDD
ncbi:HAD family hydrolase [Massilia sp. W12]|uniref:histidinol-phosphatase n=1 Tax=Massilia sp. W12 TaxID=3126507 RepID=UPI0030D4C25A